MEKLTSILAIVRDGAEAPALLDKAAFLARCFNARVEVASGGYSTNELLGELRGCRADLVLKRPGAGDRDLAESSGVPLLLAGDRPWTAPLRIAAAVDVSEHETSILARAILQATGFLALGSRGDLDVFYSERETQDDATRMERAVRLAQMVREFHVGTERLKLLDGPPERTLTKVLAANRYDVLAIGAVTHRTGFAATFANLSGRLADAAGGDVLLVPPGQRAVPDRLSARSGASRAAAAHPD